MVQTAIATVLGPAVAVLGLIVAVAGLLHSRSREDRLRAAAEELARIIAQREALALAQLLGNMGDPRPANVEFSQPLQLG